MTKKDHHKKFGWIIEFFSRAHPRPPTLQISNQIDAAGHTHIQTDIQLYNRQTETLSYIYTIHCTDRRIALHKVQLPQLSLLWLNCYYSSDTSLCNHWSFALEPTPSFY